MCCHAIATPATCNVWRMYNVHVVHAVHVVLAVHVAHAVHVYANTNTNTPDSQPHPAHKVITVILLAGDCSLAQWGLAPINPLIHRTWQDGKINGFICRLYLTNNKGGGGKLNKFFDTNTAGGKSIGSEEPGRPLLPPQRQPKKSMAKYKYK